MKNISKRNIILLLFQSLIDNDIFTKQSIYILYKLFKEKSIFIPFETAFHSYKQDKQLQGKYPCSLDVFLPLDYIVHMIYDKENNNTIFKIIQSIPIFKNQYHKEYNVKDTIEYKMFHLHYNILFIPVKPVTLRNYNKIIVHKNRLKIYIKKDCGCHPPRDNYIYLIQDEVICLKHVIDIMNDCPDYSDTFCVHCLLYGFVLNDDKTILYPLFRAPEKYEQLKELQKQ